MQLEKKKRCIAFVGDSFCSTIRKDHWIRNGKKQAQPVLNDPSRAAFPSVVADHYDLNLLAHGYGGKSWWYSRSQFLKQLAENPKIKDKLDAIVFCHTNHHRINSDAYYASSANHHQREDTSYLNEEDRQTSQAQVQWIKHLYDEEFQKWAQLNWFREISREWSHIKQVHFHCFGSTDAQHNHLLVGQRFTTPLIQISVAELAGSAREISSQLSNDSARANHLSDANNRVLAKIIIDALDNYKHIITDLDMSVFNIVNPNYAKFPNGNFGSQ
jgi:hypothetical protein